MTPQEGKRIEQKLDELLNKGDITIFDAEEVAQIKKSVEFTDAFDGDPDVLLRIQAAWVAVEGWVKVTNRIGLVIAFIVVLYTQWDRLLDILKGVKP